MLKNGEGIILSCTFYVPRYNDVNSNNLSESTYLAEGLEETMCTKLETKTVNCLTATARLRKHWEFFNRNSHLLFCFQSVVSYDSYVCGKAFRRILLFEKYYHG